MFVFHQNMGYKRCFRNYTKNLNTIDSQEKYEFPPWFVGGNWVLDGRVGGKLDIHQREESTTALT